MIGPGAQDGRPLVPEDPLDGPGMHLHGDRYHRMVTTICGMRYTSRSRAGSSPCAVARARWGAIPSRTWRAAPGHRDGGPQGAP